MWIRVRLDIGWGDLFIGFAYCVLPGRRARAVEQAERSWSQRRDFLITLSVRSAFDLALRALRLPPGSEVLLSALTVPDMVRIVQAHGLVAVPVDTDESGNVDAESLMAAISPRSRMVVVAHLFGGAMDLSEVCAIAKEHKLLVVEDCAQSFRRVGDSGHTASDVAMFSFGPIKTSTALGGAVVRVASSELRSRMNELLKSDPVQSRWSFSRRLIRFAALKLSTGRWAACIVRYCVERFGLDFDSFANSAARGFASSDLLIQLRRRPCAPLLRLLRRRWQFYKFSRFDRRVQMGRTLDAQLGQVHAASHTYWIYLIYAKDPVAVRDRLRSGGFDATCRSRMTIVRAVGGAREATNISYIWQHVVFLPWYPEIPDDAVRQMASLVRRSDLIGEQQRGETETCKLVT